MTRPSILFIDDDAVMLQSLRTSLYRFRNHWDLRYTSNARDALRLIQENPVDVVVSDYRMHGINGIELLRSVRTTHPEAMRILFSGDISDHVRATALQVAHRTLAKPCDIEQVINTIREVLDHRRNARDQTIITVVGSAERLPALPALYLRLQETLQDPNVGISQIEALISKDPSIATQIMRMASSPLFCSRYPIHSLREAIVRLGTQAIASVVLSSSLASATQHNADTAFIEKLTAHSILTAGVARQLVPIQALGAEAFLAGLLHDAGLYVLADLRPKEISEVARLTTASGCTWSEAERSVLGVTHGEVGSYLLDIWELPASSAEAAAFHHDPGQAFNHGPGVLAAVHLADLAAYESGKGVSLSAEAASNMAATPDWFRESWERAKTLTAEAVRMADATERKPNARGNSNG